jgi:cell division protein FtsI (penicillin-binding protein 3)
MKRARSRPYNRIIRTESSAVRGLEQSRLRLVCVGVFFALCFLALGLRLIEVGVVGGGDLPFKRLVSEPQLLLQLDDDVDVSKAPVRQTAYRRDIVDRNGELLASSIATASLVANPTIIRHEKDVVQALSAIFPEIDAQALHKKLMRKRSTFVYVKRHLTPAQQEAVNALGVPGLFFEHTRRRIYPHAGMFAHVLGYVDTDNLGIAGLERAFDAKLKQEWVEEPLRLSLDVRVQAMLREELREAMRTFRAVGATGALMDVQTGEIVSMVSLPEFDPHNPGAAKSDAKFNRVSLGAYEMGSVFKTFTTAAALEYGAASLLDSYDATQPIKVGRFRINDSHPENRWLSVPEIFAYSSNIGTVKMALDVGKAKLQAMLKALGLFAPVTLELPELSAPLLPKVWRQVNTMTISYGHGMSVSPLHVLRAYAAIGNKGMVPQMTLLARDGKAAKSTRAMTQETADTMLKLLRLVVTNGTAKFANAAGYAVGGKTGTAEKVSGGSYKRDAKIVSFASVFPADAPRYALLVMVDEPKGTKATHGYATGGWVAAPVVQRFVERAGPALGLVPSKRMIDAENIALWEKAKARAAHVQSAQKKRNKKRYIHDASY